MDSQRKISEDEGSERLPRDAAGPGTNEVTEIICIIDRSGSMASIRDDVIGGFNIFLTQQQELSDAAKMTLVLFDHEYRLICSGIAIKRIRPLSKKTYVPRGTTALYDAIGRTINVTAARFAEMPVHDRPHKIIVAILTDGMENSSREFSGPSIRQLITNYTNELTWDFIYLAANQDAFKEGEKMGIPRNYSHNYRADCDGISESIANISYAVELKRKYNDIKEWKGRDTTDPK